MEGNWKFVNFPEKKRFLGPHDIISAENSKESEVKKMTAPLAWDMERRICVNLGLCSHSCVLLVRFCGCVVA